MLSDGKHKNKIKCNKLRRKVDQCNHWMPSLLLLDFAFGYVFKYYRKLLVEV